MNVHTPPKYLSRITQDHPQKGMFRLLHHQENTKKSLKRTQTEMHTRLLKIFRKRRRRRIMKTILITRHMRNMIQMRNGMRMRTLSSR
jgi:hypothetical protein